jgi:hypothetical protein
VHTIDEAEPDIQRAIARWAAHRSCDVADLSGVDWIARGLAELDRGVPFSRRWTTRSADGVSSTQTRRSRTASSCCLTAPPHASQQAGPPRPDRRGPPTRPRLRSTRSTPPLPPTGGWRDLFAEARTAYRQATPTVTN